MTKRSSEFATVAFNACVMNPKRTVLWTSAAWSQARRVLDQLRLFAAEPHNAKHVAKVRLAHGQERIEFVNGSRMLFISRCHRADAARGITGVDVLVFDQAEVVSHGHNAVLIPTTYSAPKPEIVRLFSRVAAE